MHRIISPQDMLASERQYFEKSGTPSIDVMERAAQALAEVVAERYPKVRNVFIACGPGGNGGDGYACARLLAERGMCCAIFAAAPAKAKDAHINADRARSCGVRLYVDMINDTVPEVWIDCLYGTGLSRRPEGFAAELIERMNRDRSRGAKIVAADIPSGLNGLTGAAYEPCVQADVTVTFQLGKYGHCLQDGHDMCGEVICADVGFPKDAFPERLPRLFEPKDAASVLPRRRRNLHKGSCGHVLIVAGSVGMVGAAALCAKAALRSGAGLVSVACPEEILPLIQLHAPCAMAIPLPQHSGAISQQAAPLVRQALSGKDAAVIGPGLSQAASPEVLQALLESGLPCVIDADAINLLAAHRDMLKLLRPQHVLTPHPGEAGRLLGRKCTEPINDAHALHAFGCTAVLKGASRVICGTDGCYVSASGGCGMARGGSGDILTGLTGGLLASLVCGSRAGLHEEVSYSLIAAAACEIHGLAGALAQEKYGSYAMNAADTIEFIPEVFKRYVP